MELFLDPPLTLDRNRSSFRSDLRPISPAEFANLEIARSVCFSIALFFFALAVLLYVWFMILRWEEPVGVETDLSSLIQCPSWRAQNETLDVMGRYRFNSPILLCLSLHNGRRWELFSFLSRITKGPWFCVSSIVFYWSYSPFSLWAPIRKNMLFSFFFSCPPFSAHFISIHRLSIGV